MCQDVEAKIGSCGFHRGELGIAGKEERPVRRNHKTFAETIESLTPRLVRQSGSTRRSNEIGQTGTVKLLVNNIYSAFRRRRIHMLIL